ncbi:hypothetical protein [Streptomyces soliscabiei]|uniref:hypothetical protein n=1 Tax=Streptomyces soliscabiei TaxID=588897 RepID=UPI0029A373DB|nr:hypothetical protein [Streptomyces sp. NY05-11A]MDX2675804.1 hypothetical protein [Streptomyces sp. NY05-11A]
MHAADNIRATRAHRLVHASRQGWFTLPQQVLDDYDQLMQLIEDGQETRSYGARVWVDTKLEQQAEDIAVRLGQFGAWGAIETIVAEHLQPALDERLADFRAARRTAGRFANEPGTSLDMLTQTDAVRSAIIKLHEANVWYGALRTAWESLRTDAVGEVSSREYIGDPMGKTSPLAEVRNIPGLVPEWRTAGTGFGPAWPWGTGAVLHLKLGWLLDHDAVFWMPSKRQQDDEYRRVLTAAA